MVFVLKKQDCSKKIGGIDVVQQRSLFYNHGRAAGKVWNQRI